MSFLRHRQRAITALSPQPGNRRFLIPARNGNDFLLQDLVQIPFDEGAGDTVRVIVRNDGVERTHYVQLPNHTEDAWTKRPGWYTPNGATFVDLHTIPGVPEVVDPKAGTVTLFGSQVIWDNAEAASSENTLMEYGDASSAVVGGWQTRLAGTATAAWRSRVRYTGADQSNRTSGNLATQWVGQQTFPFATWDWDDPFGCLHGAEPTLSRAAGFGFRMNPGTLPASGQQLRLFSAFFGNNIFNSGAAEYSVRMVSVGTDPKTAIDRGLDGVIRDNWPGAEP